MNIFTSLKILDGGELLKNKPSVIIKQTNTPGIVKLQSGFFKGEYELADIDYSEEETRSKGKAAAGAVGGGLLFGIFGALGGGMLGGKKKKKSEATLTFKKGSKEYKVKTKCKAAQLKILEQMMCN